MKITITDEIIVNAIWHFKVEDNFSWKNCAEMLKRDFATEMTPQQLKNRFQKYFKEQMGISPYTKCPFCENQLIPKKSKEGKFIGCSNYPKCTFLASSRKPWKNTPN